MRGCEGFSRWVLFFFQRRPTVDAAVANVPYVRLPHPPSVACLSVARSPSPFHMDTSLSTSTRELFDLCDHGTHNEKELNRIKELLRDEGAKAYEVLFDRNGRRTTSLHVSAVMHTKDVVKLLLRYTPQANLGVLDEYGNTALLAAIFTDSFRCISVLAEGMAEKDIGRRTREGDTALHAIAKHSKFINPECSRALLQRVSKPDLIAKDKHGHTPLWYFAKDGRHDWCLRMTDLIPWRDMDRSYETGMFVNAANGKNMSLILLEQLAGYAKADEFVRRVDETDVRVASLLHRLLANPSISHSGQRGIRLVRFVLSKAGPERVLRTRSDAFGRKTPLEVLVELSNEVNWEFISSFRVPCAKLLLSMLSREDRMSVPSTLLAMLPTDDDPNLYACLRQYEDFASQFQFLKYMDQRFKSVHQNIHSLRPRFWHQINELIQNPF